ncbi:MAG TPA: hypothetical protein VEB43_04890 [Anaeromyxobacter sp.]|nr:hypothetical protein [Anaeromyxobacter sp.]
MHRSRMLRPFALLPLLLVVVPARPAHAGQRMLGWRSVAVEARLDDRGAIHVKERQAMVFDGDWNGGERTFWVGPGQRLRFGRITRTAPDGAEIPLAEGDLSRVDQYALDGRVLRWRSRLATDPPFEMTDLVYTLEYTLENVVVERTDGLFELDHDFAFPNRPGAIAEVHVRLELDPAWSPIDRAPAEATSGSPAHVEQSWGLLMPGESAILKLPLRWVGPGDPPVGGLSPDEARLLTGGLVLALLAAAAFVVRRARAVGLVGVPRPRVDAAWLAEHVLVHPPELVAYAFHGVAGPSAVAAVIARMEAEGKVASRPLPRDAWGPGLALSLRVPRTALEDHERALCDALFFDGDETDTRRLREHYADRGLDLGRRIAPALEDRLEALAPEPPLRRRWPYVVAAILLVVAGLTISVAGAVRGERLEVFGPFPSALPLLLVFLGIARTFRSGSPRRAWVAGLVLLVLHGAAIAAIDWLGNRGPGGRATLVPIGAAVTWLGLLLVTVLAAVPRTSRERLLFRRRCAAARDFFRAELKRPSPRLQDAWTPYLFALGLRRVAERWSRIHGASTHDTRADRDSSGHGSAAGTPSASGSGWTGGGGQFSGGGASGSWAAIAGLAAGVAAPSSSSPSGSSSSSGGSSSGSSSGGGGGGGW